MAAIYTYRNCSTCRAAANYLREHNIDFEEKPIRETPPTKAELRRMLRIYHGEIRRLFNSSGMDYRTLKLKDRLPSMSDDEALELLRKNGNLVKRPFLLTETSGRVGFKEEEWNLLFAG